MHSLALFTLATASFVSATINNVKIANSLSAQSLNLADGDYYITNVATNDSIEYIQSGQQFFPSSGNGAPITFNAHPTLPYTRLSTGKGNVKCLSAQWGYDEGGQGIGADHAGVLYACAVGDGADPDSTVEKDKQWWLFVPVVNASLTSDLTSDRLLDVLGNNSTDDNQPGGVVEPNEYGCAKSQAWIQRHPLYVKGPMYNHIECATLLRPYQLQRLGITAADMPSPLSASASASASAGNSASRSRLAKRQSSDSGNINGGIFNIITLDHLLDMETRALTGASLTIEGSKATDLVPWDVTDPKQQWIITAAN